MLCSTHPSAGAKLLSQVSAFLFGVFFQLVLDVLDELLCKGGIKLEEQGNLPVLNSKARWQRCDASPDAASKYRHLIYYPAGCWIWYKRSRGAVLMLPLARGQGLPIHIQCRSSHWLKEDAKQKIDHELSPWVSPEKWGRFAAKMLWVRTPHSASQRGLEMCWHKQVLPGWEGIPPAPGESTQATQ